MNNGIFDVELDQKHGDFMFVDAQIFINVKGITKGVIKTQRFQFHIYFQELKLLPKDQCNIDRTFQNLPKQF